MKQIKILFFLITSVVGSTTASMTNTSFEPPKDSIYIKDYNQYWKIVNDYFAYFDTKKTDWKKVKEIYQPVVDTISNLNDFIKILEKSNNELYNFHTSLNINTSSSSKLVPTSTDIWVRYDKGKYYIASIRKNSKIEKTAIKVGLEILSYIGIPIKEAVIEFMPRSFTEYDTETYEFAANMLLAGKHDSKRAITVNQNKTVIKVNLPYSNNDDFNPEHSLLDSKILEYDIGYIKINNGLGNNNLITAFDEALDGLMETKGLILDLRETPSGGNNTIAKAIMGRFIDEEQPYQRYRYVLDEKETGVEQIWTELVIPRGETYAKPLVVLVGRWTGSMGEGITIGFDGMQRAEIVGTEMAKLIGSVWNYSLNETGVGIQLPYIKIYHVDKSPREDFVPEHSLKDNSDYLPKATKLLIE